VGHLKIDQLLMILFQPLLAAALLTGTYDRILHQSALLAV